MYGEFLVMEWLILKNNKYTKCETCLHPTPVVYDELLGEEITSKADPEERFREVKILENMTADERYEFWSNEFFKMYQM